MADFTIYIGNKNYSSWSLRPWLALRHADAAFEGIDRAGSAGLGDQSPRHSPSGRVPVLQHGALTIWETLAICEYLAEQFPDAHCGRRTQAPAPTPAP
jgi:glutathione S-transferase